MTPHRPEGSASDRPREVRAIDAGTLMGGAREIHILHREEVYRLRITANEKLILTK